MKILVDAMGGDNAPLCVLQGVSQAAAEFGDGMELVLLGEEKAICDCAKENKIDLAPFEILNCTETIDMHDAVSYTHLDVYKRQPKGRRLEAVEPSPSGEGVGGPDRRRMRDGLPADCRFPLFIQIS